MANSKPKKRKKLLVFSLIFLALAGLAAIAVFKKREPIITVQTEKVARTNITETVIANGKIQPVTQVIISPEVAGEIVALPVKEGNRVKKGDLLVQIKPDNYQASRNSAEANHKSAIASKSVAKAELDKAEAEFARNQELFRNKLVSDSVFLDYKTAFEVAKLRYENSAHYEDQAKFGLDKAKDDLSKTTIVSPIDGTVTRLRSQLGERVLGTSFNMGTEIMTVADLNEMEARVDIGEMDVVLISLGQTARLEVDAFKDRKFAGVVTEIANSSKSTPGGSGQEAIKFEVRIRVKEKEIFRPGMSINAEIETRSRTNVLAVPIASVTTRLPKEKKPDTKPASSGNAAKTNSMSTATSAPDTNTPAATTHSATVQGTNTVRADKKPKEGSKAQEVVFVVEGDHSKMVAVKIGISDDTHWEITEGLTEGQEIISGGYRAISRDLEDGKKIRKGAATADEDKK